MKMIVCAIFDRKVLAYGPPMFFRTKGEAIRSFMDAVKENNSPMKKYPDDYFIAYLAEYDDATGEFFNHKPVPEMMMNALDCIQIEGSVN